MEKINQNWNAHLKHPFNLDIYTVDYFQKIKNACAILDLKDDSTLSIEALNQKWKEHIKRDHPRTISDIENLDKTQIAQVINKAKEILKDYLTESSTTMHVWGADVSKTPHEYPKNTQGQTSPNPEQKSKEEAKVRDYEKTFVNKLGWLNDFKNWKKDALNNGLDETTIQDIINRGMETSEAKQILTNALNGITYRQKDIKYGEYNSKPYELWVDSWNKALRMTITEKHLDLEEIKKTLTDLITQRITERDGHAINLADFKNFWETFTDRDLVGEIINSQKIEGLLVEKVCSKIEIYNNAAAECKKLLEEWKEVGLKLDIINFEKIRKSLETKAESEYRNIPYGRGIDAFISFVETWMNVGWQPEKGILDKLTNLRKVRNLARQARV